MRASSTTLAATALACASLLSLAAGGLLQPNSSAALFKNETAASLAAKDVSLEALRAHAAGLAAAVLPDKAAALLSKPRKDGYPAGTCRNCTNPRAQCEGRACEFGACSQYTYAGSRASRNFSPCVSDVRTPCDDPANTGCSACALWQEVNSRCAPMGATPLGCVSRGDYAIMPSRETTNVNGDTLLCATTGRHYMLVPTRACTGVDSDDPLCTGSKAEYWWGIAFDEAVLYGIAPGPLSKPPPAATTMTIWGNDVPVAPNTPSWSAAVNPVNRRSQHQTHIRFAKWQPSNEGEDWAREYSNVLPDWLAIETFSVDKAAPTLVGPAAPVTNQNNITQWPLLATLFVPTPASLKPDAYAAKVWATASKLAETVGPTRPYGIMIAPRWQAAFGPGPAGGGAGEAGKGPIVPGVTVTVYFDIGAGQMMDETPDLGDCVGLCDVWRFLGWEGRGARPHKGFNSWVQASRAGAAAAAPACDVPPAPAGMSDREWAEVLGLSW